jgi:hypothetical protein
LTVFTTHRSENLFEALEKRDLTDEEKLVIEKRVAHQRKMLEIYEKREKQRKISELCELCPDLSKEEAEKALELANGREDEAATALVSDPNFKRRIRAALGGHGAVAPREGGGGGSTRHHWAAKPSGTRPRIIDPTSLADSVFVGTFRGKGFQGVSKAIYAAKEQDGAAGMSEAENLTLNIFADNSRLTSMDHLRVQVTPEVVRNATNTVEPTPDGVPTEYILVKETSNGKLRPVTDTEIKQVFGVDKKCSPSPEVENPSVCDPEGKVVLPTRKSTRSSNRPVKRQRHTTLTADFQEEEDGSMEGESILEKIITMTDAQAVNMLLKMSAAAAASMLQRYAQNNPERAVALREGLDASTRLSEPKKELASQKQNQTKPEPVTDSEATVIEAPQGLEQGVEAKEGSQILEVSHHTPSSSFRPQRAAKIAALAKAIKLDTDADVDILSNSSRKQGKNQKPVTAVSCRGHTNRGRVKQKSHKSADIVDIGTLHPETGWYNSGYIFPMGFHSRTLFRSSVALDQLCVHECFIEGNKGKYWPSPTFKVVALDRPDEPLVAKSCTGCWTAVLKRINAEINARREAGEDLPPPPKTAIAGPEYFGLNQPNIQEAIEQLDPEGICTEYWAGKEDRERAVAGLPSTLPTSSQVHSHKPKRSKGPRPHHTGGANGRRRMKDKSNKAREDDDNEEEDDDETRYVTNRWSAVNRAERYKRRLEDNGEEEAALKVDEDNPLPDVIDPITLEPVIRPAISPFGHVMGAATWKAVLAESGLCPFTKKPLSWEQCRILTLHNIEAYRDKIIR